MNSNPSADLHLHTNHSDGYYSPAEILEKAHGQGISALAIVDHDEISALGEAREHGERLGIEVLTGVELSVTFRNYDLHILGYCFDPRSSQLLEHLDLFRKERVSRARRMVEKLAEMGMPISFQAVMKKAGQGSVGRPHIANVLVEDGFVSSFQEAFNKYIGNNKPAYVDKYKIDAVTAFGMIKSAGGVSVVAHPGIQLNDDDLFELIKLGVEGIEVIHPKHNEERRAYYAEIAAANALLQTGGSDFHGGYKGDDSIGKYNIPYETVEELKKLAGHN